MSVVVKFSESCAGDNFSYYVGQVAEISDAMAEEFIRIGWCEETDEEVPSDETGTIVHTDEENKLKDEESEEESSDEENEEPNVENAEGTDPNTEKADQKNKPNKDKNKFGKNKGGKR